MPDGSVIMALIGYSPQGDVGNRSAVFVRSTDQDPETGARRDAPLTPRHQAGIVTMWEEEGRSRVGVELYYTGRQALEDDPYRTTSLPYLVVGILAGDDVGGSGWAQSGRSRPNRYPCGTRLT